MSAGRIPASARACASCVRRSWLLSTLSATLEYQCGDRARLFELLKLSDCPDLVENRGHTYGSELKPDDKRALRETDGRIGLTEGATS